MEWPLALLVIVGGLIVLMATGLPVAFAFLFITIIGAFLFWGGEAGLKQLTLSIFWSVSKFTLLPLVLFTLMGDVMFHSGIAPNMIDTLDKWLGRLPGRLSFLAVGSGTLLSTLTGSSMASTAILGSVLVPDMEKRGYKKPMTLGPILGSGGLAMMIPPSGLAILLGSLAEIDIGSILIAIIVPGLLMAALYAIYIVMRCMLQPSLAPAYKVPPTPISEKLLASVRNILPVGFIVFMVIGVILLGIATPTEAAATGALGTFILAAYYRKLNKGVVANSVRDALKVSVMVLLIIASSQAFSQILAFTGATNGLVTFAIGFPVAPIFILIAMQVVLLILGTFMSAAPIMVISIPLFIPIVDVLGFNLVWFAVIFLLNIEMAQTTPPFGLSLFVMKSVAPRDTTMGDIYRAGLPFLYCDAIAMALINAFPAISLWLLGLIS